MEYLLWFLIYLFLGLPIFFFGFSEDIRKHKHDTKQETAIICVVVYLFWLPFGLLRLLFIILHKLGLRIPIA